TGVQTCALPISHRVDRGDPCGTRRTARPQERGQHQEIKTYRTLRRQLDGSGCPIRLIAPAYGFPGSAVAATRPNRCRPPLATTRAMENANCPLLSMRLQLRDCTSATQPPEPNSIGQKTDNSLHMQARLYCI